MALRDSFQRIMDDYERLRRGERGNPQARAGMQKLLTDAEQAIQIILRKADPSVIGAPLTVRRHHGRNRFPCQAWVAVLNTNITTTTERGFFPTYLVASYQRPPQVVLSLTSGFDNVVEIVRADGGTENDAIMKVGARTTSICRRVRDCCEGVEEANQLLDARNGTLRLDNHAPTPHCEYRAKLYAAAHICGIKYGNPLPSEEELAQNLINMLKVYKVLVDSGQFSEL